MIITWPKVLVIINICLQILAMIVTCLHSMIITCLNLLVMISLVSQVLLMIITNCIKVLDMNNLVRVSRCNVIPW
jgi:hypothetical protein